MTAKTIVLLNPMGADVTTFVNQTPLVPQLLNGTVFNPGDTLYTLPYNNTSGIDNITHGVSLLDSELRSLAAASTQPVLVFGYSEGCQVADMWVSQHYADSPLPVPADQLSFLLIGNADRKFGGFAYHQPSFAGVCYTGGLPSAHIPWAVTDLARQYDPIGDFPQALPIREALAALGTVVAQPLDLSGWGAAMTYVGNALSNTASQACVTALLAGLNLVHINYLQITPSDANILWYTDPVTSVRYGISPTYPVPSLGVSTWFPALDLVIREEVEQSYDRVFGPMPLPPQDQTVATVGPAAVTATIPPQAVLAQVAGILSRLSLSNIHDYRFTAAQDQIALVMGEWQSNRIKAGIDLLGLQSQLAAIQANYPYSGDVAQAIEYVASVS